MKLILDVSCYPPDVYTKFQTDIAEHVENSPENLRQVRSSVEPWK